MKNETPQEADLATVTSYQEKLQEFQLTIEQLLSNYHDSATEMQEEFDKLTMSLFNYEDKIQLRISQGPSESQVKQRNEENERKLREIRIDELEDEMLELRKAMQDAGRNDKEGQKYAEVYAEYKELLEKDVVSGNAEEEDCNAKLAIYDPNGEEYANYFASDDEDE